MGIVTKVISTAVAAKGKIKAKNNEAPALSKGEFVYTAKPKGKNFTVGFGKESILPADISKRKYYVAGYGMYKPATGILDTIYASAIWIDDNSGNGGVLFVSVDCVGINNCDILRIRKYLKPFSERTGCRAINICSTHSHASIDTMGIWGPLPITGRTLENAERLRDGIISAAEKAYADSRSGALYHGTIDCPDVQEDIRLPHVFSQTLNRFRFVPEDGSREIYFCNFAAHPETLTSKNSLVSADYISTFRTEITKKTGAEVIYFNGAIGGMITMPMPGKTMPERIEVTKGHGVKLANFALAVENEKQLLPQIGTLRQEVYFDAANTVLMTFAQLSILQVDHYFSQNSTLGYLLKTEMNYCEIGGIKLIFLPGELFPELAYGGYLSSEESAEGLPPEVNPAPLIEIADDPGLIVFGLANDEIGYIIPPNDFILSPDAPYFDRAVDRLGRRHYEETNSIGPNTAPTIASVFEDMMETVKMTKAANK